MSNHYRALLIVLDGVGIGSLPDAEQYGDQGADTLGHVLGALPKLQLPTLQRLGLGNIRQIAHLQPDPQPVAAYGKMQERAVGKDSTTGHWEMCGVIAEKPFKTF